MFHGCSARSCSLTTLLILVAAVVTVGQAHADLTLELEDWASLPITGQVDGSGNPGSLARVNFMRDEPGDTGRAFVNDLNGPLYILDKSTKSFTTYLQFNGDAIGGEDPGMFDHMTYTFGYANGLVSFQFDPDYESNGIFYTIHTEDTGAGSRIPDNTNVPGLDVTGYTTTTAISSVGDTDNPREAVLIEWTDTNPANSTFEGTARELLRVSHNRHIHPMADMAFNPNAGPSDDDWRVMYVAVGDGGAGETSGDARLTPQRLDLPTGKVLRIIPDLSEHTGSSTVSANGRYRIPDDNPFTSTTGAMEEIYALGLRNPHRMDWDAESNELIVNDIGLFTWEEVNLIHAGGNYGYSQREGTERLLSNNSTTSLPNPDEIPVQIDGTTTSGTVTPLYPVIQYGHGQPSSTFKGDAISSGFVYRGEQIPALQGKYIFGDITTGQLLYADYQDVLDADDGDPNTLASLDSIDILWDDPNDAPDQGTELYTTLFLSSPDAVLGPMHQIVERGYHARGGEDENLPGGANITGPYGRTDMRIAMDADGELYILSKMDGRIRALVGPMADADFNDDLVVDGRDFLIWQRNAGGPGDGTQGDADGDGNVTANDLSIWESQYGTDLSSGGLAAVPEPGALALGMIAIAAGLASRRR